MHGEGTNEGIGIKYQRFVGWYGFFFLWEGIMICSSWQHKGWKGNVSNGVVGEGIGVRFQKEGERERERGGVGVGGAPIAKNC